MMNSINVAKRYFALSNDRDLEGIKAMIHDKATYSSDNTGVHFGKSGIMEMMVAFYDRFPQLQWNVHSISEEKPDIVTVDFTLSAEDKSGNAVKIKGIERLVIDDETIRHIEVRNKP